MVYANECPGCGNRNTINHSNVQWPYYCAGCRWGFGYGSRDEDNESPLPVPLRWRFAIEDSLGRIWNMRTKSFGFMLASDGCMDHKTAARQIVVSGGTMSRVVLEDSDGPCCYVG